MNAKKIVSIALISLVGVVVIVILLRYMAGIFHRDNPALIQETQLIGTVSGYNPRVMEIQQVLQTSGFEPGSTDGIMRPQTREAIKAFQQIKLLPATGAVDDATMLELNRAKEMIDNPVGPIADGEGTAPETEMADTAQLPARNSEEGIAVTLEEEKAENEAAAVVTPAAASAQNRPRQIQTALKNAGFYKGPVDGKIGKKTKAAIIAFQKAHKLRADGVVGRKTWMILSEYCAN